MSWEFREGFVQALGHRIYWKSIGDSEKGTILALTGGGLDHHSELPLADLVQFGYRVVFYDRLGTGRSQRLRSYAGFNLTRDAREAEAVRRKLHLGRCHLVGYSYGGALALEAALRYPRSFRGLVVSSAFASYPQHISEYHRLVSLLPRQARRAIEDVEEKGKRAGRAYREARALYMHRHVSDTLVHTFDFLLAQQGGNPKVNAALNQGNKDWDVRDRLGRIRVPTLVTVGIRDHCTPRLARTIHRGIRGSKLVIFRRSGHDSRARERDLYMDVVRRFLDAASRGR